MLAPGLSSARAGGPVRSPRQVGKGLGCQVGHPEVLSPGSLYLLAEDGPGACVCPGDVVIGRARQGWGRPRPRLTMPRRVWPRRVRRLSAFRLLKWLGRCTGQWKEHRTGGPGSPGLAPTPAGPGAVIRTSRFLVLGFCLVREGIRLGLLPAGSVLEVGSGSSFPAHR